MTYIKSLKNISREDYNNVGGKAANLAKLVNAGFNVPNGFVLMNCAYEKFVYFNNIDTKISSLIENINRDKLKTVSHELKKLFEKGTLPTDILNEINDAYEDLDDKIVVVRSSSSLEDLPDTSFAGQYDSFLNIKGEVELTKVIKKCWASLWNYRALTYRFDNNLIKSELSHNVLIQKLVKADKSGITFTANPINNRRDQIVINSSWGLGEAIVSSEVFPDQWIISKETNEIVESNISTKEKMTVLKEISTSLTDVPLNMRNTPSLNELEIQEICKLSKSIEHFFDKPQDIEWVFYNNSCYIVQSRPITTLFPELKPKVDDSKLKIFTNFLLVDKVMPEPLTPLGLDVWSKFLKSILPKIWIKNAGGRLFVDTTELSRFERGWNLLENNPSAMDPLTVKTLIEVFKRYKTKIKQERGSLLKVIFSILSSFNISFLSFIVSSFSKMVYGTFASPENAVEKAFNHSETQIKLLKQESKEATTKEEKLEFIETNITKVLYYLPLEILYYVIKSFTYLKKVKKIFRKHSEDITIISKVEKSLPHNVTTEMNMKILEIAKDIDQSDSKLSLDNKNIQDFMNTYGHRAYLEIDPGVKRWQENPSYIITLISTYLEKGNYNESIEKFYTNREEAIESIQNIYKTIKAKGTIREAKKARKLLIDYRNLFGVRELPKYTMSKGVAIFREIFLEIGVELVEKNLIEKKEDISFLSIEDIKSDKNLYKTVKENKKYYYKELERAAVPRVMTSKGEVFYTPSSSSKTNTIFGLPVSSGVFEGLVKIIKNPEEGWKLNKGDILVTKATNPVWTPLFLKIGGLITEMGGPMSHGSVVAREYGIPSVAGVNDALKVFSNGQKVELNGNTGEIRLIES